MWVLLATAHAEVPLTVQGYAEARGTWTDAAGTPWTLVERLRPSFELELGDRVALEVTPEFAASQGRYAPAEARALLEDELGEAGLALLEASAGCALPTSAPLEELGDVLSLERLFLDVRLPAVDLRLGRQAVNWGSALVLNPTDVFAETIVAEPWRERAGVDALRATVPLGESAQLVAVGGATDVLAEDPDWRGGLRGTASLARADLSGVAYVDGDGWFVGADLKGDLTVGWWLEGGLARADDTSHVEVSAGLDYSFPVLQVLYVAAQVSYDSGGLAPEDLDPAAALTGGLTAGGDCSDALASTSTGLSGQLYGVGLLNWRLTDTLSVAATTMWNLQDGTGLVFPYAGAAVGDRLSLNAGAQVLAGEDGEFRPNPEDLQLGPVDLGELLPTWTALGWVRVAL